MDEARLNALKLRVSRADTLATEITELQNAKTHNDAVNLNWSMRCDIHRAGRDVLLKQKEAELESLLKEPEVVAVTVAESATKELPEKFPPADVPLAT